MTNRERILFLINNFGMVASSALRQALTWYDVDMSIEEINAECMTLLRENRICAHDHRNWNEILWMRLETSRVMRTLWGHYPA